VRGKQRNLCHEIQKKGKDPRRETREKGNRKRRRAGLTKKRVKRETYIHSCRGFGAYMGRRFLKKRADQPVMI